MSREFIREDYLKLEIVLAPVLPGREIAIAWLSELDFEVFEPNNEGLTAFAPALKIDNSELSEIKQRLESIVDSLTWTESSVETENWNAKWEESYEEVNVDGKIIIRAPFHDEAPSGAVDIVIQPDMSFGTGHHDTTWLMSKATMEVGAEGKDVLDMGCGTGVLALLALKLNAKSALAIDIDEGAVENTIYNAQLNNLHDDRIEIKCGTSELISGEFDLIQANINRNVLLDDMQIYDEHLKPDGNLLLSGFFIGDVDTLKAAIEASNIQIEKVLDRNGWACIICGKPEV